MATLFNTKISDTYVGLLKTIDNAVITASLKELTDGSGNQSGLYLNTAGDFKVTSILEWGSLKDTGTGVTITQFVTAANGIQNFNNDTTVPTSAAVKLYVDTKFATSDTLAEVLVFGNTTSGRDIVVSANDDITFTDSSKAKFGASGDLEIYHNGSHSYISDVNTGSLYIQTNGSAIYLQDTDGKAMAQFSKGGGSFLMYNGNLKLGTSNTGATVTGNLTVTGTITGVGGSYLPLAGGTMTGNTIHNDGVKSFYGTGSDLEIYYTGANAYIKKVDGASGSLFIDATDLYLRSDENETFIYCNMNEQVELMYNGSKRFETSNTGVTVTGNILPSANVSYSLGSSSNSFLYTYTYVVSSAGDLQFLTGGSERMRILSNGNVGIGTTAPGTINGVAFSGVGLHVKAGTLGRTITEGTSFAEFIMNHSNASANQKIKFVLSQAGVLELGSMDDNGTRRTQVSILNNNNVGIGTTSPVEKLHVNSSNTVSYIHLTNSTTGGTGNDGVDFGVNGSDVYLWNRENSSTIFGTNGAERLRIGNTGNVGIGTAAPTEKLEVDGIIKAVHTDDSYATYRGNGVFFNRSDSYLAPLTDNVATLNVGYNGGRWGNIEINAAFVKFENGPNEFMRITSNGNVGIGTTSPSEKLHVDGNIRVNSGSQGLYSSFVQAISSTGLKIGNDDFSAFAYFHNDSNIGINTTSPNASSLLDVSSTTKGVLLPRMTTTQVNAISSPANGLTVYNTTLNTLCFYNGTSWQKVTSANM